MAGRQDQSEELSQAAERQRRYRQRRRAGIQIVPVEVDAGILNTLIREGRLSEQDLLYSEKIAAALRELAEEKTVGHQPPERPLTA
jgi:hypothetical protein